MAPRGAQPPIRLRRVPASDPPFDDELSPEVWAPARQLALDLRGVTVAGAGARVTTSGPSGSHTSANPAFADGMSPGGDGSATPATGPRPPAAPAGASGDARLAVRRFVALCVEVINGYRPAAHLRQVSAPGDAARIIRQAVTAARQIAESGRAARAAGRRMRRPAPVGVVRVRLCEPRPGAVEAAVLLVHGERTRAMAIRLELRQQDWAAVCLQLI
ncbi:Rv3235 family protein [Mangrovihabitans endophyticus]|nr:Rv3235 family protein [Mangrovihabitans endophyticus]